MPPYSYKPQKHISFQCKQTIPLKSQSNGLGLTKNVCHWTSTGSEETERENGGKCRLQDVADENSFSSLGA